MYPPPKSYLKSQIPKVIIFGDKGAKEVMKVKEVVITRRVTFSPGEQDSTVIENISSEKVPS